MAGIVAAQFNKISLPWDRGHPDRIVKLSRYGEVTCKMLGNI